MQLTKEQIQRINNFLEGIGIEYADVRFEMVDHIATEIEEKVADIPTFFKNEKFQTPFIKYMLSRKEAWVSQYEKQLKKGWRELAVNVLKGSLKEMLNIKSSLILVLVILTILTVAKFNLMYAIVTSKLITYSFLLYYNYTNRKFLKDYTKVRIIKGYNIILSFIAFFALCFPYGVFPYKEDIFTYKQLIILLILCSITYLVFMSFLMKKRQIQNKYQFLIN